MRGGGTYTDEDGIGGQLGEERAASGWGCEGSNGSRSHSMEIRLEPVWGLERGSTPLLLMLLLLLLLLLLLVEKSRETSHRAIGRWESWWESVE